MTDVFQYNPDVFERSDETHAREIILTDEAGLTSQERWDLETAYMKPFLDSLPKGAVLDYGCGIGRLSKVMIDQGRPVWGLDQSAAMRTHARLYVGFTAGFLVVEPDDLPKAADAGVTFAAAIAVWVLQHIPAPFLPIADIARVLPPGAPFLVVNRTNRCLPVIAPDGTKAWIDDRFDLDAELAKHFTLEHEEAMPLELCEEGAYLRIYRR